jgi:hypothetical protein
LGKKSRKEKSGYKKKHSARSPVSVEKKIQVTSSALPSLSKSPASAKNITVDYSYVFSELRYIAVLIVIIVVVIIGLWIVLR